MQALLLPFVAAVGGLSAPASAAPTPPGNETEWRQLDREIASLDAAATAGWAGPAQSESRLRLGALLKANYAYFDDTPVPSGSGNYSGFALDNVRPWVEGEVGDMTVRLLLEARNGPTSVLDAFARWDLGRGVQATFGQFQPEFLASGLTEPQNMLFVLRTRPGQFWQDNRDQGVLLSGTYENIHLSGSLQNGIDDAGSDFAYTLRARFDALGGGISAVEGAYGSGRSSCLSVGVAYHNDDAAAKDGDAIGVDVGATMDRFALGAEWVDFADDGGAGAGVYQALSDTSPWAVTASYMIDTDKYELAARYEDWDVSTNINVITVGVNRYMSGHNAKWSLNWRHAESDLDTETGDAVGLGLTVNL